MKCSRPRKRTDCVICCCQLLSICFLLGQKWRKKFYFWFPPSGKRRKRRRSCQSGATDDSSVYPDSTNISFSNAPTYPSLSLSLVARSAVTKLASHYGQGPLQLSGLADVWRKLESALTWWGGQSPQTRNITKRQKSFRPWKVFLSFSFLPRPQ